MTDKILIDRAVVEQALEALEIVDDVIDGYYQPVQYLTEAEAALRAALEQPQGEQEPVAWVNPGALEWLPRQSEKLEKLTRSAQPEYGFSAPLYTHPQNLSCKSTQARLATLWGYEKPQPPRQPLTEMEIVELRQLTPGTLDVQFVKFARAIEHAHGIGGEA